MSNFVLNSYHTNNYTCSLLSITTILLHNNVQEVSNIWQSHLVNTDRVWCYYKNRQ